MHFLYGRKFNKLTHHSLMDDIRAKITGGSSTSKSKCNERPMDMERQVGIYRALCELIDTGAAAAQPSIAALAPALIAALGERGPHVLSERMDHAICSAKMDNTRDAIVWLAANGAARSPVAGMSDMPEGADELAGWLRVSRKFSLGACLRAVSWCGLAAKLDPTLSALAALEEAGIGAKDRERVFDNVSLWCPDRDAAVEACALHHPWVAAMACHGSALAPDLLEKWRPKNQADLSIAWDAAASKSLNGDESEIEAVFKHLRAEQVAIQSDAVREEMLVKYAWLLRQAGAGEKRAAKAVGSWLSAVPGQASDVEVAARMTKRLSSDGNTSEFQALARSIGVVFASGAKWATAGKPRGTRQEWRDLACEITAKAAALPAKLAARDSSTRMGFDEILASLDSVDQRLGKAAGQPAEDRKKVRL